MEQEQTPQNTQPRETSFEGMEHYERVERVSRCANCDIEFFWPTTVAQGSIYCCTGCAAGGPCNCDYSLYRPVMIMGVLYYKL